MSMHGPELAPVSGKKAKQLVLFLHGVGADGNDLISLSDVFADLLPDAHFASPHAPFPFDMAPYGHQWFSLQKYMQQPPEVVMRDRSTSDELFKGAGKAAVVLNGYIDDKLKSMGVADKDLLLIGFSQGTMMALHTALRRAKPCMGVIGYSGALLGADKLKGEVVSRPPVCLIHGGMDPVVPSFMLDTAEKALEDAGVKVETHLSPSLGHGIDDIGIRAARDFISKILKNS